MKQDNRGMTLVELLIAITMLALITTPFFNSFFVSVKNNNKARNVLRATTVAQNLMEGLKAFSVEDICRQINLEDAQNTKLYLPKPYKEHKEFPNENGEISEVKESAFQETASHKYVFGIQGIEEDGILYDARILLDASGYRGEQEQNYNEGFMTEIHKMSEETDVIYSLPVSKDREVEGGDYREGSGTMKRNFHIVISEDAGKTKVEIAVTYGKDSTEVELPIVGKTVENLENIYVMYYPNYHSVATDIYDCFEVDVKQDVKINLHLIKQKYAENKSDTLGNYAPALIVREEAGLGEITHPRITLKTNIGKNLYQSDVPYKTDALQYTYYKNGSNTPLGRADAAAMLGFIEENGPQSLLGEDKKIAPLYKATVQIYPAGTYDNANPQSFDAAKMLVQLEN